MLKGVRMLDSTLFSWWICGRYFVMCASSRREEEACIYNYTVTNKQPLTTQQNYIQLDSPKTTMQPIYILCAYPNVCLLCCSDVYCMIYIMSISILH